MLAGTFFGSESAPDDETIRPGGAPDGAIFRFGDAGRGSFFGLGGVPDGAFFFGLCAPNGLFFGPGRISGRNHPARGKRAKELKDKQGESPAEKE